jgi:hypothetical protein
MTNSKQLIVSPDQPPPPHPFYGDSYERGVDPFHPNAFKGFDPSIVSQVEHLTPGEQKSGWFLLDGWGQQIGFTPDGFVFEMEQK